jgi:2-dehydropantoate 2-reductase
MMKKQELSFLVVGAGAVGGITAALLKKAGYNVEIACKHAEYASLISTEGIQVRGACGDLKIPVAAYPTLPDVKDKKDVIIHATKATDMIDAALSVRRILKDNGFVISMQNGICVDDLASVLGHEKIIGCITGWGATMESPGRLVMTSTGDFILGYPGREPDSFLVDIASVMSSVVPAKVTGNIMGHLYAKLIINSCITSLGAICGLDLGEMLSARKVRRIFIEIIREAVETAEKMQIKIEIFGGKLDFRKFIQGDSFLDDFRRHMLIRIIGFKYRKLKSSSLQSLERGKMTEVNYFNGYIMKNGNLHNVPVPVNTAIVNMIHEIEVRKRSVSVNNFNDRAFDCFNG